MTRTLDTRQLLADLTFQLLLTHELSSIICVENHISCSQLIVLKRLSEVDATCCTTLSTDLKMAPSTVTGICNALEKNGYITRQYSLTDRRRVYISITDPGKSYLEHARDSILNRYNAVSFDQSDLEKMMALIQKLNHTLRDMA